MDIKYVKLFRISSISRVACSWYRSARQRAEELLSRPYRRDLNNEAAQMELLTSNSSSQHYTDNNSSPVRQSPVPASPRSSTQYTTSSHYTSDPATYTGASTRYSTPSSDQYNTNYTTNGKYTSTYMDDPEIYVGSPRLGDLMDNSPPASFGNDPRYSRNARSANPDKGLFDDV